MHFHSKSKIYSRSKFHLFAKQTTRGKFWKKIQLDCHAPQRKTDKFKM